MLNYNIYVSWLKIKRRDSNTELKYLVPVLMQFKFPELKYSVNNAILLILFLNSLLSTAIYN